MAHSAALAHRVRLMREALGGRLALHAALEAALAPPPPVALCGSTPTVPARWVAPHRAGGRIEVRWRPLGPGILLSELDASMASGVRARSLLWSVVGPEAGELTGFPCHEGPLRPTPLGGAFPRPGE